MWKKCSVMGEMEYGRVFHEKVHTLPVNNCHIIIYDNENDPFFNWAFLIHYVSRRFPRTLEFIFLF